MMMFSTRLVFLCVVSIVAESTDVSHREEVYHPSTVSKYGNYGSISLFRFNIPEAVSAAFWNFTMMKSDDTCGNQDIHISIHAGGPPIVNPDNTSLPESVDVRYATGINLTINTGDAELTPGVSVPSPRAGDWFVIAYRLKDDVDKIEQKGIGVDCHYQLQPQLLYHQVLDIPVLSELTDNVYSPADELTLLRYHTKFSSSVMSFSFYCSGTLDNKPLAGNCPLNVTVSADRLPLLDDTTESCLSQDRCSLVVSDALKQSWYYLLVQKSILDPIDGFNFTVRVEEEGCDYSRASASIDIATEDAGNYYLKEELTWPLMNGWYQEDIAHREGSFRGVATCAPLYTLVTLHTSGARRFVKLVENDTDIYPVERNGPFVVTFDIDPVQDVGGFLAVGVDATSLPNPAVTFCMKKDGPPVEDGVILRCDESDIIESNLTSSGKDHWYFPNIPAGTWYLGLEVKCYNASDQDPFSCGDDPEIVMAITVNDQCIDNCGSNGQCYIKSVAGLQLYYCKCYYGYAGLTCSDDTAAWSRAYFLTRVLLLTLSNVIFLVAAIFAFYRHHFAESVAFVATMIFSTLYHACDSSRVCVMDYDTLQFCDFYASFLSILLVLIAMAKLNPTLRSTAHITGAFFVAFAAKYDRFSLWAVLVPLIAGLIVVAISWGGRMYHRKQLYPSKKRWIFFIVPGALLALVGLVFTALETEDNYYITHSLWHLFIGGSVLFLLPPRPKEEKHHEPERELLDVSTSLRDYLDADTEPYSFMTGE